MNDQQQPDGTANNQQQPDGTANDQQQREGATHDQQQPGEAMNERLLGVLHDLVDDVGPGKTAALLGVDRKTLWRVLKEGRLTPRLVRTVERQARTPAGQNAARRRVRRDSLDRRVAVLEREVPEDIGELRGEVRALAAALADSQKREQARTPAQQGEPTGTDTQQPEPAGPPARESAQNGASAWEPERTGTVAQEPARTGTVAPVGARAAGPPPVRGVARQPVIGERRVTKPRRDHPELVTLTREAGEELVYGDATPLILEWRAARRAFLGAGGSRVERADGWVRMCELELVLVGEHGLTLPPDTYPWDAFRREKELWRRRRSLQGARRERRRALLWRFLWRLFTLGLRRG